LFGLYGYVWQAVRLENLAEGLPVDVVESFFADSLNLCFVWLIQAARYSIVRRLLSLPAGCKVHRRALGIPIALIRAPLPLPRSCAVKLHNKAIPFPQILRSCVHPSTTAKVTKH
jgi:hypothetical protein